MSAPPVHYTLSLHDALPICDDLEHLDAQRLGLRELEGRGGNRLGRGRRREPAVGRHVRRLDRKSTRLNSSHLGISYAVFCLKKKKTKNKNTSSALYLNEVVL